MSFEAMVDFVTTVAAPACVFFCFVALILRAMIPRYNKVMEKGIVCGTLNYFPVYERYTYTKLEQNPYTGVISKKLKESYVNTGFMVSVCDGIAKLEIGFAHDVDIGPVLDTSGWWVERQVVVQFTPNLSASVPCGKYIRDAVSVVQDYINKGEK
jgi:hypothetical protein